MKKAQDNKSPPVKVVGFRVEGATPSPRDTSLADAAGAATTATGSPSPVIIPPGFGGKSRGAATAAASAAADAAANSGDATPTVRGGGSGKGGLPTSPPSVSSDQPSRGDEAGSALPHIRTASHGLDPDSFAKDRTPTKSQPTGTPRGPQALPLTPVGASAPADLGGQFAAAAADSPRVIESAAPQQPAAATAAPAAAGAASPAAAAAAAAAPSRPPPPRSPPQQQQPAAAASAAPAARAAEGGQQQQQQQQRGGPPEGAEPKRSMKEMSKAERRAVQEAQRAAKAAAKGGGAAAAPAAAAAAAGAAAPPAKLHKQGSGNNLVRQGAAGSGPISRQISSVKEGDGKLASDQQQGKGAKTAAAAAAQKPAPARGSKMAEMFAHLPQPRRVTIHSVAAAKGPPVPLAAVKLGLQYGDGSVRGGNARCIAMLQMFNQCIQEFRTPSGKEFAKEFSPALNNIINFLVACRPLSISMGNAIKSLKSCLEKMKLQPPPTEQQAKDIVIEKIQDYLEQKIRFADRMLVKHAIEKIKDGETILTYAYSSVVAATLLAAHKAGKRFDVMVVDSRPLLEGRRMLTTLLEGGITCEYLHLNGLSYEITEVDKVFLGAASVLSNGTVLSRVGTAAVALMAAAQRVPVLVCCETYKFHERVQLDSITHNELMDPAGLAQIQDRPDVPEFRGWQDNEEIHLLNLAYDLTPPDCVSVVISEMGAIPPSSVAVILREAQRDSLL